MADWTYGEQGKRFPVKDGQVWEVGKHLFVCSDLMETSLLDEQLHSRRIDLLYCDPPWGTALLNGFRTKAGKEKAGHTWQELYRRIADFGHDREVDVWLEGSKRSSRDGQKIPGTMHRTGYQSGYWDIRYYRKHPCGLYFSGRKTPPQPLLTGLHNEDDEDTPRIVMEAYGPTGTVLDPCTGMGATPVCAEKVGWGSVNNEMNGHRISVSLSRLADMTGETPRRVK